MPIHCWRVRATALLMTFACASAAPGDQAITFNLNFEGGSLGRIERVDETTAASEPRPLSTVWDHRIDE